MSGMTGRVAAVARTHFPAGAPVLEAGGTFGSAGLDSLSVVEFLLELQREFGVPMRGDELTVDSTLHHACALLRERGVPGACDRQPS